MDDASLEELRQDDPEFVPTALDRALFTLGVQLTAKGLFEAAQRVADASAVLHYFPYNSKLEDDDPRALYDTLSGMAMAAAMVASEMSVLAPTSEGTGDHD